MKKSRTFKILMGVLSLFIVVIAAFFFTQFDFVTGSAILAIAPIAAIKAESISDTEKLSAELNKVFSQLSADVTKFLEEEIKAKGMLNAEDLTNKFKEAGIEATTIKQINESLLAHGLEIQRIADGTGDKQIQGLVEMVKKSFAEPGLAEKIQKAYQEHSTSQVEVTKAVGAITTGNVSSTTGGVALLDMLNSDEINDIRMTMPFIEDYAATGSTNKPTYSYTDYIPGEGDVEFIAEGGEKSQIDLDIQVRTASPCKAAGYEILTEEAITDIPRLESNARGLLFRRYLLRRQNGILFGDGNAQNPLGVTHIATAFDPNSWKGEKIISPNLHDAIVAAANQIYTAQSYVDDVEFYPNVAFVNPADMASLRLAKDKNGQYLFPSFSLLNEKVIDGIRVVPKNKIPAGKLLIGDFQKLNIIDYIAYSVRIGFINDQFIKNLFTMLGEGRFYVFVKYLDQRAFLYDDFDNIIAGIEAIEA